MSDRMSDEKIKEKLAKAHQMVSDLCHGREEWLMQIPARPDKDPDLVIASGLYAGDQAFELLIEAREAEKRLDIRNKQQEGTIIRMRKENAELKFKLGPTNCVHCGSHLIFGELHGCSQLAEWKRKND